MERKNIGLFRGIAGEKGMVEGFYAEFSGKPFIGVPALCGTMMWYAVFPETVGEFTGRTVGGKKLFEGDIVQYTKKDGTPARYQVEMDEKMGAWMFKDLEGPGGFPLMGLCDLVKIIGNVNEISISTFADDEKTESGLLEE